MADLFASGHEGEALLQSKEWALEVAKADMRERNAQEEDGESRTCVGCIGGRARSGKKPMQVWRKSPARNSTSQTACNDSCEHI